LRKFSACACVAVDDLLFGNGSVFHHIVQQRRHEAGRIEM
jgi:hypothetical protein